MARMKKFRVQKRFEVWAECEIRAKDFQAAVEQGRAMNLTDFLDDEDGAVQDTTEISGFSVGESW